MNIKNKFLENRYNHYTIKSVDYISFDQQKIRRRSLDELLSVKFGMVDDTTQTVLMNVELEYPIEALLEFLNLSSKSSKSDISSKLLGTKFFEPTKEFRKGLKDNCNKEIIKVGISNEYAAIDVQRFVDYISAYPTKSYFESFKEEKGFRRDFSPEDNRVMDWGRVYEHQSGFSPIDSEILELIRDLNKIDFVYTKGESCSATPKDHGGEYANRVKEGFGIGTGLMGYIILRADTSDPRFLPFKRGLENLCNVELSGVSYKDPDENLQQQQGIKFSNKNSCSIIYLFR